MGVGLEVRMGEELDANVMLGTVLVRGICVELMLNVMDVGLGV